MANVASAEKKNRQRIRHRARNQHHLSTMRSYVKRVRSAIEAGDAKAARDGLAAATQALDRAAQKGVVDRRNASRKISRLTVAVNALAQA